MLELVMNTPIRPTRASILLLLAALCHYMVACPCGCLDENPLYQACLSLVGWDVDHDGHEHSHPKSELPHITPGESQHLDGAERQQLATSRSVSVPTASFLPQATVLCWQPVELTYHAAITPSTHRDRLAQMPAPEIRALFSILLI